MTHFVLCEFGRTRRAYPSSLLVVPGPREVVLEPVIHVCGPRLVDDAECALLVSQHTLTGYQIMG